MANLTWLMLARDRMLPPHERSCGTTNTGSVDDLHALADLAMRERLWLNADGAYGASFALSGLIVRWSTAWPGPTGCLGTRTNGSSRPAGAAWCWSGIADTSPESFATRAKYLQDAASDVDTPKWDYGIELTRPARIMKLCSLFR